MEHAGQYVSEPNLLRLFAERHPERVSQRRSGLRGRTVARVERLSGFANGVDRDAERVERLHRLAVPGTEDPHQQVDAADRSGSLPARLAACVLARELGLRRREQPFGAAARRHQVAEPAMCRLAGDAQGSGHGAHRLAQRQGASHVLTLELDEFLAQVPQRSQRLIRRGRCRGLIGQSADSLSGYGHAHTTPMRVESLEGCRSGQPSGTASR